MANPKGKKKFLLWIYPSTQELVKNNYRKDHCKSQSEFIERAIQYYVGRVNAEDDTSYLPNAFLSNMRAIASESDNRVSRMLFKLAHEGDAPKIFGRLSKRVVPNMAILGISGGILIGFILDMIATTFNRSVSDMFVVVFSSSVLPGMIPWFVILLAELRYRRNNPDIMADHPFKLPLYPLSNYFAFLMLIVIVIFMFINPDTRISVIVGAAVLIIATIVYICRWGLGPEKHQKTGSKE